MPICKKSLTSILLLKIDYVFSTRFLFDGRRVNGDDTPEGLGIEEGDIISVYGSQEGGVYKF